jgi:hypothetical protein
MMSKKATKKARELWPDRVGYLGDSNVYTAAMLWGRASMGWLSCEELAVIDMLLRTLPSNEHDNLLFDIQQMRTGVYYRPSFDDIQTRYQAIIDGANPPPFDYSGGNNAD